MIEVDNREPVSLIKELTEKANSLGIEVKSSLLERGDFTFTTNVTVAIERKAAEGDLMSSLSSGRLQYQMHRMLDENIDVAILGIEGCPHIGPNGYLMRANKESGWKWTNVCGLLTSIQKMGIYVHWIPKERYAEFILSQYSYWSKESHQSLLHVQRPFPSTLENNIYDNKKRLLMTLPSVGETTADRILKEFDSDILKILSNPDDLIKIPGLGKERISKIKEVINGIPKN